MALTCRDLKQDFGFWPEIEVRPSAESWPLRFISRKLNFHRKTKPSEKSEAFIRRGKKYM